LNKINSPQQAVEDFAHAAQWLRKELGCSVDKSSPDYCPVVTVAGSYPGFLSAMLRVMHPDSIDITYATSAPIYLYGHEHANEVYYDYVTKIAYAAVPGCAAAVNEAIVEFHDWAVDPKTGSMDEKARDVKICPKGIPRYITESASLDLWWTESMRLSLLISPKPTWDTILRAQTQNLKSIAVSS
jgi:Serine carboxypeptidase S28